MQSRCFRSLVLTDLKSEHAEPVRAAKMTRLADMDSLMRLRATTTSAACLTTSAASPSDRSSTFPAPSLSRRQNPSIPRSSSSFSSLSCQAMPSLREPSGRCHFQPHSHRRARSRSLRLYACVPQAFLSPSPSPPPSPSFLARSPLWEKEVRERLPQRRGRRRCRRFELRAQLRREYLDVLSNRNVLFSPLPDLQPGSSSSSTSSVSAHSNHCPIYVMLPLDTVTIINTLNHPRALQAGLRALKSVGVDGVMVDVWWGIVEADGPGAYDWSAYAALVRMVRGAGLKLQAVMSFHGCGGNVGDDCHVSLPGWVLREALDNPDVLYTDRDGNRNSEYLSLGVDRLRLFSGRSPLEMYADFIASFRDMFWEYLGTTIVEVAVGLGPAGELRYPAYPEGDQRWRYPGIGEFQCFDKYMLASLRACAEAVGRPEWGLSGPHDSGSYNQTPEVTGFFHPDHGSWRTDYGRFFLSWYSQSLIAHGSRVLAAARRALADAPVLVAAKLPGIHWWYRHASHPAELTAGYYNTAERCGYEAVVRMLARHGALLNFTCVEMGDDEQPWHTFSSPESLLLQVRECCARYGVPMSGENALPRFDTVAHRRIRHNAYRPDRPDLPPLEAFTFLRLGETLFEADNWRRFVEFVRSMDDVEHESVARKMMERRMMERRGVPHAVAIGRSQRTPQKPSTSGGGGRSLSDTFQNV